MKKIECIICKKKTDVNEMHNAEPVKNGLCCTECNYNVVIEQRLKDLF